MVPWKIFFWIIKKNKVKQDLMGNLPLNRLDVHIENIRQI